MTSLPNAASVALIDGDEVLLIQRARAPYLGMWSLPGGRLEAGETPEQCAAREVKEEVGLTVGRLMKVKRMRLGDGGFELQVFATEAFEGEIVPSDEVTAFRWIRPGSIGALTVTPGLDEVLERAFAIYDRRC